MNLVLITALVAVAGAAKLDRTYLPPASAKTAGGTGESLKTPFAGNSFNNGLGGIPKGSYTNDFQGVVVDAAAAGTRASEPGDTGLGAPRISYGSIDSKVGAAAFKVNNAGFRQPIGFQAGLEDGQAAGTEPQRFLQGSPQRTQGSHQESQGFSNAERPKAALDRSANTVRFESDVGPESFSYVYETDNGISAEESGVAIDGVQAQGAFSYTGDDGQVYSVSYTADEGGYQPKGDHLPTPPPIPEEILRSLEQNARDEAAGLVDDGSYDALKYNAGSDYAAADNSNGKYNHQSSKFGNGAETDATASGTFISQNNQPFARPGQTGQNALKGSGNSASNSFGTSTNGFGQSGHGANDFTGHGTSAGSDSNQFSGQFNHGSSNGQSGHFGTSAPQKQFGSNTNRFSDQSGQGKFGASSSGLGQSGHVASTELSGQSSQDSNSLTGPSGFGQSGHAASSFAQSNNGFGLSSSGANKFTQGGQTTQENRFGSQNEYLPPKNSFNQNRPQSSRLQGSTGSQVSQFDQEPNTNNQNVNFQPLQPNGQNQNKLQGSVSGNSFGRPGSDSVSGQFNNGVSKIQPSQHASKPSSNVPSNLAQDGSSQISGNGFGSKNEYLPPINNFGQRKPNPGRPQGPTSLPVTTQFNQQYNSNTETSEHFQSPQNQGHPQDSSSNTLSSVSGTQPTFGSQSSQQFNSFQRPQSSTNNGKPSQQDNIHFPSRGQFTSASTSSSFPSQQSTTQPDTELTTPLETSGTQQNIAGSSSSPTIPSFTTNFQSNRGRPTQPQLGNRFNNGASASPTPTSPTAFPSFGTQSTSGPQRPSQSFGNGQTHSSAFPTHVPQGQFNQNSQFGNRQPSSSFSQSNDAQYSPSTQRPTYYQQSQNSDDSYNYNQPSKPFGIPQGSKFPSAPSNQFNRVTQGSSFSSSQTSQFPRAQQGSHTGFPSQSGQLPGSTKYPKPPTLAAVAPTSSSQDQGNAFNGITQASISPFPSESPTQSTQFNKQSQFGSRPNYQQSSNQFGQSQSTKPSFGLASSQSSFGQQTTAVPSFPQRSGSKRPSFQGQTQTFGQLMLNQNGPEEETSESTPSQQYNGEIYEYNKPAQTLPAPDHDKEDETAVSSAGQFGQKQQNQFGRQPAKPQFGQSQDSDNSQSSTTSQFTQAHGSRPQSQFGQQNTQIQNKFGSQSKDQFGAQPSRPFSSANQFNQGSESQGNQLNQGNPQFGTQNSGGPFSSCCQSKLEEGKPTQGSPFGQPNQGFVDQTQNRFGGQSTSFASNQGFESESSASSFAGKGEVFGGPRKPPSFDEETGYHY